MVGKWCVLQVKKGNNLLMNKAYRRIRNNFLLACVYVLVI